MARGDARAPNPARDPSQTEIKRALVAGGLCRGRAGGGRLVARIGSWREGHHGQAAGRRAARGSPRQRARANQKRHQTKSGTTEFATRIDSTARERVALF